MNSQLVGDIPQASDYFSTALQPFLGPWSLFFGSVIIYTVGRTHWSGDQPVARPLPMQTDIHASSTNRTHDLSVSAGDTVYALDLVATVIGFRLQDAMTLVPVGLSRHLRKYHFGPCLII
jgi:hypothetical protein